MSARRAVLLTLLAVVLVLALAVGGFLAFREYDDVRDRAEKAERELAALKNRPSGEESDRAFATNSVYAGFVADNVDLYSGEKPKPSWYAVYVVPNTAAKEYCCVIDSAVKMQACRDHFWTPADPATIWTSRGASDDDACS